MNSYVTDTQAMIKFMQGRRVIDKLCHEAFLSAERGESVIVIPACVLMDVLYLFEKKQDSHQSAANGGTAEKQQLPI